MALFTAGGDKLKHSSHGIFFHVKAISDIILIILGLAYFDILQSLELLKETIQRVLYKVEKILHDLKIFWILKHGKNGGGDLLGVNQENQIDDFQTL